MRKRIYLRNYKAHGLIGVHAAEKSGPQPMVFNIELTLDTKYRVDSDHIEDAVDYDFIRPLILDVIQRNHTDLQETIVQDIVGRLFHHSDQIHTVLVRSSKTAAYADCESVDYEIETSRSEWMLQESHNAITPKTRDRHLASVISQ